MTRAIICDIDGTLADIEHRRHFVSNGKRDWNAFFSMMADDGIVQPILDLCRMVAESRVAVILCSGRPESYREVTEAWLAKFNVPYDALYMRPADDTRADYVIKAQLYEGIKEDGYEVFLVVDDRQSVVDFWRNDAGLVCLQAAPGDFDTACAPGQLTIMVGPSGAGKSTFLRSRQAAEMGLQDSHILSSDQIRQDICSNALDQSKNDQVFQALHAVARARLRNGLNTVIDATNIRRKDRIACVDCAPAGTSIRYIVINRPMEGKRLTAGWRAEFPGLMEKHEQTFQSQLKDILAGDHLPNVSVIDLRIKP